MSYMNAVTPPDASKHWCPFARCWDSNDSETCAAATNRASDGWIERVPNAHCVAHRCMAWRWAQPVRLMNRPAPPGHAGEEEPPRPENLPEGWKWSPPDPEDLTPGMWIEPVSEAADRALGYCSLAGDPAQRQAMENLTLAVERLEAATQHQTGAIARGGYR